MNPLETAVVAFRPVAPKLPFGQPDSIRLLDPTMPQGATTGFKPFDANGDPVTVTNELYNFGWEYVWHCHILEHEDNEMMRPDAVGCGSTPPAADRPGAAGAIGTSVVATRRGVPIAIGPRLGRSPECGRGPRWPASEPFGG